MATIFLSRLMFGGHMGDKIVVFVQFDPLLSHFINLIARLRTY